jgi:LmbE family N-acetylglucosaminyl deacetylase
VYLSPHLDDAVLSCGGRIWQRAQAGERVIVVTVFAGDPEPGAPLSPFAQELHALWGHSTDATNRRREEDIEALVLLGAEGMHWPYADCIYRQAPDGRFFYGDGASLWGEIDPAEDSLIAELATRLAALPLTQGSTIYTPLGVGRHVDHRIVRRAAERSGCALVYYEDFPYAQNSEAVRAVLATGQWRAELATPSEEALEAKIAAIACYRSQISTFWSDTAEMSAAVRTFGERYWKAILPCPSPS